MTSFAAWVVRPAVLLAVSVGLFLNPAGNAGVSAYRMAITPPELVGRVQSAAQFVSMLSIPLAPALAGALLAVTDGTTAVLAVTALVALAALIPTLARSVRSIPRPADWQTLPSNDDNLGHTRTSERKNPVPQG